MAKILDSFVENSTKLYDKCPKEDDSGADKRIR